MIFLITKMFVYLVLAAGIGIAAGWLLRNMQAQQTEEKSRRSVHEVKSKVPQLESLLRGRDEQIVKLKNELKERRQEQQEIANQFEDAKKQATEYQQEAMRLKRDAESRTEFDVDVLQDQDNETDDLIAELGQEIAQLKDALAAAQRQALEANEVASAAASNVSPGASENQSNAHAADVELLTAELDAARLHARQLETSIRDTSADLQRQRDAVSELERERELQNKSLHVMHQQLELERSNRLASG